MHPAPAASALNGGLFTVVRVVAYGTRVGGRARVRALARHEKKKFPDGSGEEVREENSRKEDKEKGKRGEKSADFTGAVLSSQQERAPHEKGEK